MKEEKEVQEEYVAWINKQERILTFCEKEGFEKLTFKTHEDELSYVYNLCESGYRIL